MSRVVTASSQIETAYPATTAIVHPGSLKPWVRGSVAVVATSIPIAARRSTQAVMSVLYVAVATVSVACATSRPSPRGGGVPPSGTRREQLAEAATDHALRHGLIGLSLRPLAAAIGTSDRMLLYHFRDKDDLVATVLRVASDQAVAEVTALPVVPGVRAAVLALWLASSEGLLERCQRLYVQAAALGLLGEEPYVSVVREANERWVAALVTHLRRAGCPEQRA